MRGVVTLTHPGIFLLYLPMSDFSQRLLATKSAYPFDRWKESDLPQYTDEACVGFLHIFDELIARLIALGENASAEDKLAAFESAVRALNRLNEKDSSLIETGEREDLCKLCNTIATAAGLNPEDYGDGEGPASEWRDW